MVSGTRRPCFESSDLSVRLIRAREAVGGITSGVLKLVDVAVGDAEFAEVWRSHELDILTGHKKGCMLPGLTLQLGCFHVKLLVKRSKCDAAQFAIRVIFIERHARFDSCPALR
jgi:hypothetical protein